MSDLKSLKVIVDKLVEQVKTLQENCDMSDIQSLKSDISECRTSLNAREQYVGMFNTQQSLGAKFRT